MTRGFSPNGVPTDQVAAYYKRRAGHEVGLIITEGTFIDETSASPSSKYPNFFGGASLRGWKQVLEAVHTTHCKIAPQLCHVGMARPFKGEDLPNPEPVSYTHLYLHGNTKCRWVLPGNRKERISGAMKQTGCRDRPNRRITL